MLCGAGDYKYFICFSVQEYCEHNNYRRHIPFLYFNRISRPNRLVISLSLQPTRTHAELDSSIDGLETNILRVSPVNNLRSHTGS